MKKVTILTLCASLALFTTSCTPPSSGGCIPSWYLSSPKSDTIMYAVAQAESSDMEFAVQQAEFDAVDKIAGRIKSEMGSYFKRIREEVKRADDGLLDNVSKVQDRTVKQTVSMYQVPQKEICEKDGKYQAFVQCTYDMQAGKQMAMEQMKRDQRLNDIIRGTDLYEEAMGKLND